jgi:hypothetical protein
MNTKNKFLKCWFNGVNKFIDKGKLGEVNTFLRECAQSCSDSYSLKLYENAFKNAMVENALNYLQENFSDFNYKIYKDKIEIVYSKCGCVLVQENLIRTSKICLCSEKSLLFNWEKVYGKNNVTIKKIATVLEGNKNCIFEIRVKQLGHDVIRGKRIHETMVRRVF